MLGAFVRFQLSLEFTVKVEVGCLIIGFLKFLASQVHVIVLGHVVSMYKICYAVAQPKKHCPSSLQLLLRVFSCLRLDVFSSVCWNPSDFTMQYCSWHGAMNVILTVGKFL